MQAAEQALDVWASILADVEPDDVIRMTVAYTRSPKCAFWPKPGELLHALPTADSVDDADEAWGRARRLVAALTWEKCPTTVEALRDIRQRLGDQFRDPEAELQRRLDAWNAKHRAVEGKVGGRSGFTIGAPRLILPSAADLRERARRIGMELPDKRGHRDAAFIAGAMAVSWKGIAHTTEDTEAANRASFRAAYRASVRRGDLRGMEAQVAALLDRPTGSDAPTPGIEDKLRRQLAEERARDLREHGLERAIDLETERRRRHEGRS